MRARERRARAVNRWSGGEGGAARELAYRADACAGGRKESALGGEREVSFVVGDVDLSGTTVLAIDDRADARDLLGRVLGECQADVILAASSDEGLQALKTYRPHVMLCDIGMPDKDGYEFIREMRELGHTAPAVAVTAFARPEDRLRAMRAGYQGHIGKPLEPAELVATVAAFAKGRAGSQGG